jgi:hypothetical protein
MGPGGESFTLKHNHDETVKSFISYVSKFSCMAFYKFISLMNGL